MKVVLPLDEMTTQEKLSVMEQLWDDLCRHAEDIPSPAWHEEILAFREQRVQDGKAEFVPLDEMRERIGKATERRPTDDR
jgi:putative addiction module component (TIGR02574 family)